SEYNDYNGYNGFNEYDDVTAVTVEDDIWNTGAGSSAAQTVAQTVAQTGAQSATRSGAQTANHSGAKTQALNRAQSTSQITVSAENESLAQGENQAPSKPALSPEDAQRELDRKRELERKKQQEVKVKPYQFPPVSLLAKGMKSDPNANGMDQRANARKLEQVIREFGVGVTCTNIVKGPRVTRFELTPDVGVRVNKITALAGDIKLALAAKELRIEAPIPGKSAVGIEVPNEKSAMVTFRDIMDTREFKEAKGKLTWGIGLDIQGSPIVGNIAKMPHLLISGTTGSGKSVAVNTVIMSILYRCTPEEVKMILIDPKVVELSIYDGIPHLLTPVVTKPSEAVAALSKTCDEMNRRYRLFKESNTRNIKGYNDKVDEISKMLPEGAEKPEKLPYILVVIDELAELMMHSKKDVETYVASITQLARAAGIHLIVVTQRPSVDVVTGLIKSNIPSRVGLKLPSAIDSRTILDQGGAESLLGNGDMLCRIEDMSTPVRVQGAFLADEEVDSIVEWIKKHNSTIYSSEWEEALTAAQNVTAGASGMETVSDDGSGHDEYFYQAGVLITEKNKASIGMLQRKFSIGFNRASRIMDQLFEAGVVSDSLGTKERQILMTNDEFKRTFGNE
ncbi:MAG: DNA translocase FtsK, partial [Eubacteriales bacterium]|nr:DNA translocase FtsK [Eubacteriales bacterium]